MISKLTEVHRNVAIVATPTSPILSPLLHNLTHKPNLNITVITRETSVSLQLSSRHPLGSKHNHHASPVSHVVTTFDGAELVDILEGNEVVICCLSGSDLHLSAVLIAASKDAGVKFFMPSEYGLDTSNPRIRELLPPYQTRYEIQEQLKESGMRWKALYTGIVLEDAMTASGVLDLDVLWASVAVFPHEEGSKVAISSHKDIADTIVKHSIDEEERQGKEQIWECGFRASLEEIIATVEKELHRELERYEADLEAAKREAEDRLKMGYFDGGVSLMQRVAVWDKGVKAWTNWNTKSTGKSEWQEEVKQVVRRVRNGEIGGAGCGC